MSSIKEIIKSPLFARQKKKLHKKQVKDLDNAVRAIVNNPEAGSLKIGDLGGIMVYKFRSGNALILLAYEVAETTLFLYTFGSHQNFYRKLKQYIDR